MDLVMSTLLQNCIRRSYFVPDNQRLGANQLAHLRSDVHFSKLTEGKSAIQTRHFTSENQIQHFYCVTRYSPAVTTTSP